jgi:predicted MFS family arabinose efflux permease
MRWRVLLLLFLARTGLGFQFQTMGSVGDDLARSFGLTYAEIGTLIGFFMVPGLFLALPAGLSGRYLPDRFLAGAGLAALALGGMISGTASETWMVGAGRLVAGAGFLFATLYFTKMTADWFAGREIATAMGILVMSWPFGIAMGQVGHEFLAGWGSWRWPFFFASAWCALGALAVIVLYRPPGTSASVVAASPGAVSGRELHLILLAGLAWGAFNGGYVVYLNFAPLVLEAAGATMLVAAGVVSIGSWVMIFSGAVCGQVADRSGRPELVLTLCMAGAVASLLLLAVDGGGVTASLLFGLVGMAPAGIIMALAGEAMRPDRRAFGMGIFFTVYYAVMATVPPVAGWIYDGMGRPFAPILFGMVLFAAVLPATFLFRAIRNRAFAAVTSG